MKLFTTLILFFLTINYTSAQTAKDWYWPIRSINKATFYTPDVSTTNPTNLTKAIYYSTHNDVLQITTVTLFNGQPTLTETRKLVFSENEVKTLLKIRIIENNPIKSTRLIPPQTIFKLPTRGHTATWVTNGLNYKSTWTFLLDRGIKVEAIKVVEDLPHYQGKFISYYVKGYGLVKTTNIFNGKNQEQILDKFHTCSYDNLYNVGIVKGEYVFSLGEDIFEKTSFEETLSRFTSDPMLQLSNIEIKSGDRSSLSLISKYENLVINNIQPNELDIQTKYDDKDFRVILWNDKLYNKALYNRKNLKDLGYDYIGVTEDDNGHITYSYRNCEKNLTLDLTEWYNVKLSIYISWFSDVVRNSSGRFIGCPIANN